MWRNRSKINIRLAALAAPNSSACNLQEYSLNNSYRVLDRKPRKSAEFWRFGMRLPLQKIDQ